MVKWHWRSSSMTSIFNTICENPKMHIWCKFGDSSSNTLQVIARTSQIFQNSKSKWTKWPWRLRTMIPIFNTSSANLRMHVLCKLWWFYLTSVGVLSYGQAEFPRILSQNGQNDLEDQGQWLPFSIPPESIPRCTFGANLVISAQICDELSRGQGEIGQRNSNAESLSMLRKISNIRRTKFQNLNDSHFVLQSSVPNPLRPGVKSRMKMWLEQRRQAMLQLHLSDQQFNLPTKVRLILETWR